MADLSDYEWLTGFDAARYLSELAKSTDPALRQIEQLRKVLSVERARLAVQQAELRRRAVVKFGERAACLFFTDVGLQQATDAWIAAYKANRFPGDVPIADYCCGVGGDLMAFAQQGRATGWDRSPEVACLTRANLAVVAGQESSVEVGAVEDQMPNEEQFWHLDPDRRTDGRRSTQIEWHSPGPELVESWLTASRNGALKLAPATAVPESWALQGELEWVSRERECRQLVVWFGELAEAPGQRRATCVTKSDLDGGEGLSFVGRPDVAATVRGAVANYVYDTDPAVRAAKLTGALAIDQGLQAISEGASYLTSDEAVEHPLLSRFDVIEVVPLRAKTLGQALGSLRVGQLEIKKRGVDADPVRLRKSLKLSGDRAMTVLLTRQGRSEIAIIASRCEG